MDSTTVPVPTSAGMVPEAMAVMSLYETLQPLSDAVRAQGKHDEVALILCLLVIAKLAGQTSLSGATDWTRLRATDLADHFGLQRMLGSWEKVLVLFRSDILHGQHKGTTNL
jgi:hypothetical protein